MPAHPDADDRRKTNAAALARHGPAAELCDKGRGRAVGRPFRGRLMGASPSGLQRGGPRTPRQWTQGEARLYRLECGLTVDKHLASVRERQNVNVPCPSASGEGGFGGGDVRSWDCYVPQGRRSAVGSGSRPRWIRLRGPKFHAHSAWRSNPSLHSLVLELSQWVLRYQVRNNEVMLSAVSRALS